MAVPNSAVRPDGPALRRKGAVWLRRDLAGWGFLAPFMVAYALFVLWPVVDGLRLSFYNWSMLGTQHYIGLDNYRNALQDSLFWTDVWHTIEFAIGSTVPLVLLGFVMALLANQKLPAQWLFRLAFFSPYVLPVSIVYLIWNWLYSGDYGLFNSWLNTLGLSSINWLSDPGIALWSVIFTTVWWTVGFNFVLYLAGLQEIPVELFEAARIDGAGGWAILWKITIPLLQRVTTLVVILQVLASLKVFDQIYLMTGGGPDGASRSAIEYIYETGFQSYRLGSAAAMSYLFFIMILVVGVIQFVFLTRGGDER